MTTITPCLWFNDSIDDAIAFYLKTFPGAKLHQVSRREPDGHALTATIELAGQKLMLLNGSGSEPSMFPFSEAVSLMIHCEGQTEVDRYWNAIVDNGGETGKCGWCKDRFGLSWQVVPRQLYATVMGPDTAGALRAMQAMLKMEKLLVADLETAYAGP